MSAKLAVAPVPAPSVTVTPRVKLPAAVGVPDTVPPESNVMPAGRAPLERPHL